MRHLGVLTTLALAIILAACGPQSSAPVASFTRSWDDGRVETLDLYGDGRVQMNHNGTIERLTLSAEDVHVLEAGLGKVVAATDPLAYPRLTLTPAGQAPVVVATDAGSAGALFLSLLDRHRLP